MTTTWTPPPWTDWKAGASHSTETRSGNGNNIAIEFGHSVAEAETLVVILELAHFSFFAKTLHS